MIVAKYKFDPNTYADLLPTTQPNGWTYTKSDVTNSDGTIIRTLESNTLPTSIIFGNVGGGGATDKTKALLEVISLDLSNVSNCFLLFLSCTNLKSALGIKLTSKTTNMNSMFNGCSSLTSLNVNNWNTSKVTNMGYMFNGCSKLTSLDVSNFNTSNVTTMAGMFNGCSSLRKVNLKYVNQSTVSKIHENLLDRSSTTKGYILSLVNLTSDKNWETLKFSHNEFYLPQPLNKIGDRKDRLYWDYDKGHYCIEQNAPKIYLHTLDWRLWQSTNLPEDEIVYQISNFCQNNNITKPSFNNTTMKQIIKCNVPSLSGLLDDSVEGDSFVYHGSGNILFKTKKTNIVNDSPIPYLKEKNYFIIVTRPTPNIIDLPEMNQKFSFDTYLPNTSVKVTNLPIQPYSLLLKDDTARYKATIEPSTLYTIQFNCIAKSTTNLTLDLGGTRVTVDPIIGVNHVQITTPSELTSDRLLLIGTGIIINEVIVNKGDMNQYTKYFDGEQGVGELQEDGSYIIRISTDNYTGLWEGDL